MNQESATHSLKQQVIDAGLCTNCGACVNICPYYTSWNDRAVVLDRCDLSEGACHDICPRMPTDTPALRKLLFDEKDLTPEIGALKAFFVTRAADENIRRNAQHGGTVTALVDLALRAGIIDTAVLTTAEDPLLPSSFVVTTADQACQASKSHFVAVPNLATFNNLAKGGTRSIGVVATPCQALALAKMRSSKSERVRKNGSRLGLVVGLFCGWALSASPLRDLLKDNVDLGAIVGIDVPPSQYHSLDVFTADGTVGIPLDRAEECVRSSCRSCPDLTAEFSDISVGSARLPEGWTEAKSWNQVIVRTEIGQKLIEMAREKGVLEFRDVPEGNLERLKRASLNKRKTAKENLKPLR
jgi:coenzyme F420 hydrogenase subunit beta